MNKSFLIAAIVAIVLVGGGIGAALVFQRPMEEQRQNLLAGAFREGSPEFEQLTRKIIAENDAEKTWESPVGTGTIMMGVHGKLRNYSDRTLTGLEVRVTVVDLDDKPVRENTVIVVPTQAKTLPPKGEIPVEVTIEGFSPKDVRARIKWKVTAIKVD